MAPDAGQGLTAAASVPPFLTASGGSVQTSAAAALREAYSMLKSSLPGEPSVVFGTFSCKYDKAEMMGAVRDVLGGVKFHGSTSCTGSMTEAPGKAGLFDL